MTATGPDYRYAPPLLGQHTDEVLGMKAGEIASLRKKGRDLMVYGEVSA